MAANTHKYLEIYFAAGKLGMSVPPPTFRLADPEVAYIINGSETVCYFMGDAYVQVTLGGSLHEDRPRKRKNTLVWDRL